MKTINKYLLVIIFPVLLSLISGCSQEEPAGKNWYKGNLHTHSYWSDGDEFPEVIMNWYKSKDYQFVALSDHNILAEGEFWQTISEDSIYQNSFDRYLNQYGDDWVSHKLDSVGKTQVRLKTYDEYRGLFEENGEFLIIRSEEITDHFGNKPIHMNVTNIQQKISPAGGNSVLEVLQNNLDQVIKQRKDLHTPMIPHVNHPNFGYAISVDDMIALRGERFFEVFNGHPLVHNRGDSIHVSTENMWDLINISYINNNLPIMYGLATDDSHHYHEKGRKWSNAGRGWVMVRADSLSAESLIEAMESGDFYASTGVALNTLDYTNNELTVEVKTEPNVNYKISFVGCKRGSSITEVLRSEVGSRASFKLTDDLLYVRCKITSSKLVENPIEDILYQMAWTQPVLPTNR